MAGAKDDSMAEIAMQYSEDSFNEIIVSFASGFKHLRVRLEQHLRTRLAGGPHDGHFLGDIPPGELHLIDLPAGASRWIYRPRRESPPWRLCIPSCTPAASSAAAHPAVEGLIVVDGGFKHLRVRLEQHLRTRLVGAGYCDHITVEILEDDAIRVTDNGRGVPVDIQAQTGKPALEVVYTPS